MQQVTVGQTLTYDDGRTNHRNIKAVVIATTPNGFVAQFEDRADTTTIKWDDADWMRHIRFDGALMPRYTDSQELERIIKSENHSVRS